MLDTSRTAKWYLVQCKPRQEIRAEENLRNQFFSCYCPLHTVEKIRQGKRVVTQQPLFPGYLFINLCRLSDSWHSIRSTRGVLRLITFANEPLPVPDAIIDDLQARLSKAGNKPLFKTGSPVTLIEGPFKDLNAVFCKADGEERAIVLLDLLNRQQQLSVPLRALSASG
ncbi:transcription/translation regulatory transformer protein RfaH [Halopseudomonas pertucinogena]|uniref:Transcription antitermination protein RfaH n=1 Tax=Halopseudomonas pertucinogena TaxID=86175 RepID=A0ABQ2CMZ7_9GAMM|nr:transcription/translation regulatory transformer protein RfaH [Halopseudomonas pertucinogena]GGI96957.1 transcription antitermination protein RfaH [Halopseudomonas pertucinogena]